MPDNQTTTALSAKAIFAGTFIEKTEPGLKINDWLRELAMHHGPDLRKREYCFRDFGLDWDMRHPADKPVQPEGYITEVWSSTGIVGQATILHSTISGENVLTILEYSADQEGSDV